MAKKTSDAPAESYAEAVDRVEQILANLESMDRIDVDNLAAQVREASELIRYCRTRLRDTEMEVQRVVDELDQDSTEEEEPVEEEAVPAADAEESPELPF